MDAGAAPTINLRSFLLALMFRVKTFTTSSFLRVCIPTQSMGTRRKHQKVGRPTMVIFLGVKYRFAVFGSYKGRFTSFSQMQWGYQGLS